MEELRKNWHLTEMTCGWKNERENQRDFTQRKINEINAERDERINRVNEEAKAKIKEIMAEAQVAVIAEKHAIQECLISIAKREDKYMSEFRNYVASLPEADRIAFSRKGGDQ